MGNESIFEIAMDALQLPIESLEAGSLSDIETHEAEALYKKCLEVIRLYRIMEGSEEETEIPELDFEDLT